MPDAVVNVIARHLVYGLVRDHAVWRAEVDLCRQCGRQPVSILARNKCCNIVLSAVSSDRNERLSKVNRLRLSNNTPRLPPVRNLPPFVWRNEHVGNSETTDPIDPGGTIDARSDDRSEYGSVIQAFQLNRVRPETRSDANSTGRYHPEPAGEEAG